MKERLTTFALAVGALVLFYALLFPKPLPDPEEQDLPLSTETRAHGYQVLWRWLKAGKIPEKALHQPYSDLAKSPSRGDVLIVSMPPRVPPRREELADLDEWVARGNTLLVMAALDDTPPWCLAADPGFLKSLGRMTRLDFDAKPERADKGAGRAAKPEQGAKRVLRALQQVVEPKRTVFRARGSEPLFDGVRSVVALSEFPASHWNGTAIDQSAVLEIAERLPTPDATSAEPVAWLRRQGNGQILLIGFASIFENALIGEQDNARLFANIIAWSRDPKGSVIFDDDHQGAVEYYDAKAFFHDPRLHRTLLWIIVLWFLFVLGWQRLRPAAAEWSLIDITHFIGATGEFFASALTPAAAGARLFENFFNALRRSLGLPEDGRPVWEWLATDARTSAADLDELRRLYGKTQAGRRVDLIKLQNLTSRVLGILQ
jgi:Domain of unknown function (DUF4350)